MTAEVEEFLAHLKPPMREVVIGLRSLVNESLAGLEEQVDFGNRLLVYVSTDCDPPVQVCAIAPCSRVVELRFPRGQELEDPERLLTGCGPALRSVRLETKADVGRSGIRSLLQAAAALTHPASAEGLS